MSKQKLMLLGDEAIAQGAIDAGISGIYAYPGTPSTEITEYVQHSKLAAERKIHSRWSANEKTAYEGALGMSYAGKRAMSCMKHVGLNVAADPFINSAITGVNGGLIVTVADDPSMHSSQDEQDSRFYGQFAMIPMLEPSNQQEAYDMVRFGYDLSERLKLPVMMRVTTRLAHSRSAVLTRDALPQKEIKLPQDKRQFVLLPAIARKRYDKLCTQQAELMKEAEASPFNRYVDGPEKSLGIIACGLGYNYLMENYPDRVCPHPVLKISHYPVPTGLVKKLVESCDRILVIEDGMPFLEQALRGLLDRDVKVMGRLDGILPRSGELNPNRVAAALSLPPTQGPDIPGIVAPRPPALCKGCSHADTYAALNVVVKDVYGDGHVFGDIGCYTLGALPPFESVNTTVDMGASITMAKGAADAGVFPSVAIIGDSTFCHSGMTGLLDAVLENTNMVVIIEDNSTTGMTGGQQSHAEGRLMEICAGLGVAREHLRLVVPIRKNHEQYVSILKEELDYPGLSVIIAQRECVQTLLRKNKAK